MHKLNIAMFGHKRIPSREGGVEIVVEELSTRMVEKGHRVTCFNRSGHHVAGEEFEQEHSVNYKGIFIKDVPTFDWRGLAALTSSVFAAIKAAFGRYDVVHIHAEGPAFMCWFPKLMGKKVVVTVHGLDWARAKWGRFASWYIHCGERNAVRFADHIIVLSKNVQNYFWKKYQRETEFIPNGVSKPQIKPPKEITAKWGLHKDDYILYLGRIVPEKGEHYLIEAFKQISTEKKLVIAGGSSDTDGYLQRLHEQATGDTRIIFTGFVQGELLEELYSNSYIYVLPSDLEGMPLSLLEAMSYGNCCVASDIPECKEVVEDKAISFMKGNVEELRKTLEDLLNNVDTVIKYKNIAADFITAKYSWDDVVDKTLDIYVNTN